MVRRFFLRKILFADACRQPRITPDVLSNFRQFVWRHNGAGGHGAGHRFGMRASSYAASSISGVWHSSGECSPGMQQEDGNRHELKLSGGMIQSSRSSRKPSSGSSEQPHPSQCM